MKSKAFILLLFLALVGCEIDSPADLSRIDYLGQWTCNEYEGDFAPQSYSIEVEAFGGTNEVKIYGFYNIGNGEPVKAEVLGKSLYIYNQTVDGITFSGTGTMQPSLDQVNLSFTANDGGGIDHVKANWIR